jgi:hypothetical protein
MVPYFYSTSVDIIKNDIENATKSMIGYEMHGSVKIMKGILDQVDQKLSLLDICINDSEYIGSDDVLDEHITAANKLRKNTENVFNNRFSTPATTAIHTNVLIVVSMFQDITKSLKNY